MSADCVDDRKHLEELLKHFQTAMLVTHTEGPGLRARPLALASAHHGGVLYFATSASSPK